MFFKKNLVLFYYNIIDFIFLYKNILFGQISFFFLVERNYLFWISKTSEEDFKRISIIIFILIVISQF